MGETTGEMAREREVKARPSQADLNQHSNLTIARSDLQQQLLLSRKWPLCVDVVAPKLRPSPFTAVHQQISGDLVFFCQCIDVSLCNLNVLFLPVPIDNTHHGIIRKLSSFITFLQETSIFKQYFLY